MVRAFPIIDRSAALSAVLALFSEANEERRRRHPEAVEAILAKAAEYGVKRPTQLRKRG